MRGAAAGKRAAISRRVKSETARTGGRRATLAATVSRRRSASASAKSCGNEKNERSCTVVTRGTAQAQRAGVGGSEEHVEAVRPGRRGQPRSCQTRPRDAARCPARARPTPRWRRTASAGAGPLK